MKTTGRCPKCSKRKVFVISPVKQTLCDAQASLRTFDVAAAYVPTGKKGFLGGDETELEIAGAFDAMVCATCGYTEWYVPEAGLRKLAKMAEHVPTIALVEVEDDPYPYRSPGGE